jgi:predicted transcriptional regulator
MTEHGLTIDQYRSKYSLPGTYPMVAPDYAKTRSSLAKEMGLGKSRSAAPKKAARRK